MIKQKLRNLIVRLIDDIYQFAKALSMILNI